jgi:hypothetical protein
MTILPSISNSSQSIYIFDETEKKAPSSIQEEGEAKTYPDPKELASKVLGCKESAVEAGKRYLKEKLLPLAEKFPVVEDPERLLAHMLGNVFINGTFLQGLPIEKPAMFLCTYLQTIHPSLGEDKIPAFLQDEAIAYLKEALSWNAMLNSIGNESDPPEKQKLEIVKLTKQMQEQLKSQGSLFFFGGWKGFSPVGHAMLYHITREIDQSYSFHIYNTGNGLAYHPGILLGGKVKFSLVWTLENIAEKDILCEAVISRLLMFQLLLPEKTADQFRPEDVYDFLLFSLKGSLKTNALLMDRLSSHEGAGICACKVWMAFFRVHLTKQQFFSFKYHWRLFGLTLFWHSHLAEKSKSNHVLFAESCSKFTRSLAKYHREGYISLEELRIGYGVICTIEEPSQKQQPLKIPSVVLSTKEPLKSLQNDLCPSSHIFEMPFHTDIPPITDVGSLKTRLVSLIGELSIHGNEQSLQDLDLLFQTELCTFPEIQATGSVWRQFPFSEIEAYAKYLFEITSAYCRTPYSKTASGVILRVYLYAAMVELFQSYLRQGYADRILEGMTLIDQNSFGKIGATDTPIIGSRRLIERFYALKNYHWADPPQPFLIETVPDMNNERRKLVFLLDGDDPKKVFVERFLSEQQLRDARLADEEFPAQIYYKQSTLLPKVFWYLWNQYFAVYWNSISPQLNLVEQGGSTAEYAIEGEHLSILWTKACEAQWQNFQDPLLRKLLKNETSLSTFCFSEESFLTLEQRYDLASVRNHKYLQVPETLRFFQKNLSLLYTEQGRAALVRLLFGTRPGMYNGLKNEFFYFLINEEQGKWQLSLDNIFASTPFLAEIVMDPSQKSLFILQTLLSSLFDYATKNRDFLLIEYVYALENLVLECFEWLLQKRVLEQQPLWIGVCSGSPQLENNYLHFFIDTARPQEVFPLSSLYFERAERRKEFDGHWASLYAKASYLLSQKNIPAAPLVAAIKKRLFLGREHIAKALEKTNLDTLMQTIFNWANIPHSPEVPTLDAQKSCIKWGEYIFDALQGTIHKEGVRIYSLEAFFNKNNAGLQTFQQNEENPTQWIYAVEQSMLFLPNGNGLIQMVCQNPLIYCLGKKLQEVLQDYSQFDISMKINPAETFLLLENPLKHSSHYLQIYKEMDFAFDLCALDYTVHPRFQRWCSLRERIILLLDSQEKRAFFLDLPGGFQTFYVEDLTHNFVRHASLHYRSCPWYSCLPELPIHIWVWKDQFGCTPAKLELPRYGLCFLQKEGCFYCEQYPDYWLDEVCRPISNVDHVISLINQEGNRMMLVPQIDFEPLFPKYDAPLDPRLKIKIDIDPTLHVEYFVYYKEPNPMRESTIDSLGYWSANQKAMIFLAGLHFRAHNYQEALHYLQRSVTNDSPVKEEVEELLHIIEQERSCYHHNHQAVLLHFIKRCLDVSLENYVLEPIESRGSKFPHIKKLYDLLDVLFYEYTSKIANIDPAFRLPDDSLIEFYRPEYAHSMPSILPTYLHSLSVVPSNSRETFKLTYPFSSALKESISLDSKPLIIKIADDFLEWIPANPMSEVRPKVFLTKYFASFMYKMILAVHEHDHQKVMELKAQAFFLMMTELNGRDYIETTGIDCTCEFNDPSITVPHQVYTCHALLCFIAEAGLQRAFEQNRLYEKVLEPRKTTAGLGKDLQAFADSLHDNLREWNAQRFSFRDREISVETGLNDHQIRLVKKRKLDVQNFLDVEAVLNGSRARIKQRKTDPSNGGGEHADGKMGSGLILGSLHTDFFDSDFSCSKESPFPLHAVLKDKPNLLAHPLIAHSVARLQSCYGQYQKITYTFKKSIGKEQLLIEAKDRKQTEISIKLAHEEKILAYINTYPGPIKEEGDILEKACNKLGRVYREKGVEAALDWMLIKEEAAEKEEQREFVELLRNYILCTLKIHLIDQIEIKLKHPSVSVQELGEITALHHYEMEPIEVHNNRIILYFEHKFGKILKQKQFAILQESLVTQRQVHQLGCGEGKTTVLTVLLALIESQKKHFAVNVVPSSLFKMNAELLQKTLSEISHRKSLVFHFNRKTSLETNYLATLLKKLECAIADRDIVITEPQSVQSLLLCYLYQLDRIGSGTNSDHQWQTIESILRLFMDQGSAIIDEVHTVLKASLHLNYALDEEIFIPAWRWKNTGYLFEAMVEINQENQEALFFPIGHRYREPWSVTAYRKNLLPRLAENIAKRLNVPLQALAIEYFCYEAGTTFPDKKERLQQWLNKLPEAVRQELQYIRAQLHRYLPQTLQGRLSVDYGFSSNCELAIPYDHHQNPGKNAKFESIDILINYTYQLYLINGLTKEQVSKLVQEWQNQYFTHISSGRLSEANEMNAKLQMYMPSVSLGSLHQNDLVHADLVHQCLCQQKAVIFEYVHTYLFAQLTGQKEKMSSSPHDISRILFKRITAFSGTPSNHLTYPVDMACRFDASADGEALHLLFNPEWTDLISDENHLQERPFAYCMLIDPKAYLEGNENRKIAEDLLNVTNSKITHVQYFDENNHLVLLDRNSCIHLANKELCSPENRVTYCDQQHSTGTDTVQPHDGKALLLISPGLTLTDLIQGSKRMRKWGNGQRVVLWCAPKGYAEIITRYQKLTMDTLIMWCVENEAAQLDKTLLFSYLEQVHSVYRKSVLLQIMSLATASQKSLTFKFYRSLFVDTVDMHEYIVHASLDAPPSPLQKFNTTFEGYRSLYQDVLSAEDKEELSRIAEKARALLGGIDRECKTGAREVEMTVLLERDCVQTNQVCIEKSLIQYNPTVWKPDTLLRSRFFIEKFMNRDLESLTRSGFQFPKRSKLFFEPLSRVFPEGHFDSSIFATENFFHKRAINKRILPKNTLAKDTIVFKKHLPPVKYLLCLIPKYQDCRPRYILLGDKESDKLRKWINNLSVTEELRDFDSALYDNRGVCWARSPGSKEVCGKARVMAQVQFLNGETFYNDDTKEELEKWIYEKGTLERLRFFLTMQELRRHRWRKGGAWEGTVLHEIFRKVQNC